MSIWKRGWTFALSILLCASLITPALAEEVQLVEVEEALQEASAIWEGWTVVDESGVVGVIVDVIDNPAQKLLEVERTGGATVLIPAVNEIVLDVDVESRLVRVDLPNGLLDL